MLHGMSKNLAGCFFNISFSPTERIYIEAREEGLA